MIIERSITESESDEIPIFIHRLVADSGGNIIGGLAQVGKLGVISETRSCTICRASIKSVSALKIILIADNWGTDFERITSNPGIPCSYCSRGIVTSASTSSGESPRQGV